MDRLAGRLARVGIVVLLLGSVLAQVLVPVLASQEAAIYPEVAHLAMPYTIAAIAFIGCGQVALLAVWRLLSLVDAGAILTGRATRWIDVIIAATVAATVLSVGVLVHLLFIVGVGGGFVLCLPVCVVGGPVLALLLLVARGVHITTVDRLRDWPSPTAEPL